MSPAKKKIKLYLQNQSRIAAISCIRLSGKERSRLGGIKGRKKQIRLFNLRLLYNKRSVKHSLRPRIPRDSLEVALFGS